MSLLLIYEHALIKNNPVKSKIFHHLVKSIQSPCWYLWRHGGPQAERARVTNRMLTRYSIEDAQPIRIEYEAFKSLNFLNI